MRIVSTLVLLMYPLTLSGQVSADFEGTNTNRIVVFKKE